MEARLLRLMTISLVRRYTGAFFARRFKLLSRDVSPRPQTQFGSKIILGEDFQELNPSFLLKVNKGAIRLPAWLLRRERIRFR
jgi:hypothetical protein